jgi:phage shock protein E
MVLHDEDFLRRAAAAKERVSQLAPEGLAEWVAAEATLIDVREPEEAAHDTLVGSVNIPLAGLAERIVVAVPDRSTPIVCFCAGGNRGSLAAAELLDLGYSNVCSIAGGKRAIDAADRLQHGER